MTQASEPRSLDVLDVKGPVASDVAQLLVRRVSGPVGWLKRPTYEFQWHPDGRERPATWVRTTKNPLRYFPGHVRVIEKAWPDVRTVLREAWEREDRRQVAIAVGRGVVAGWSRRQRVDRGVGVAVVVLLFAALMTFGVRELLQAPHETATTVGTVTEPGSCGSHGFPATATFTVQGRTYTADAPCAAKVGDRVQVQYDPGNPGHSQGSSRLGYVAIVVGALCLTGLVPALRGSRTRRSDVSGNW